MKVMALFLFNRLHRCVVVGGCATQPLLRDGDTEEFRGDP